MRQKWYYGSTLYSRSSFVMNVFFNVVFSMKRLIDMRNGKHKGDEFDVQLVVDDKKNLKYVKVYKNGKIFEVKDVNEIPVNDNGEANAKEN